MDFVFGPPRWIEWEGVRWYQRGRGTGHYADRTGCLLHVAVWERVHGQPLPDGHVVHHVDHDVTNNDPGNLQLLTRADHIRLHNLEHPRGVAAPAYQEQRSAKARDSWADRPERERTCTVCATVFMSKGQRAMYCSPQCKAAAFRADHRERGDAPLPERECEWCGTGFIPPDRRTVYCGGQCRQRAGDAAKRARNRARLGIPGCEYCGTPFEPKDGRQRFCGDLCRTRYGRREGRARWAG